MRDEKQKIADSFSKSARTYDEHADVQKIMADKLLPLLPRHFAKVLDIGSGTGLLEELLIKEHRQAKFTGIDMANGMVKVALAKFTSKNINFLTADAESMPFGKSEFDLVVSNASLQWMDNKKVFRETARILKQNGVFCFTTFGPNTLKELKNGGLSVNNFLSENELKSCLLEHFDIVKFNKQVIVKEYDDIFELFFCLKETGAQNPAGVKGKGLLTKKKIESLFGKNEIKVRYEIFAGSCKLLQNHKEMI